MGKNHDGKVTVEGQSSRAQGETFAVWATSKTPLSRRDEAG
jgi:hypothetical protein